MILLTGGAGYIGSHTCVELIQKGYHPLLLDNFSNAFPEVLHRIKRITGREPECVQGDIRDRSVLDALFVEYEIESVIHFAGLKAIGESVTNPLAYYQNNVTGTITLLQAMESARVRNIIFSSSATVYGEKNPAPYTEEMPTGRSSNPYGQTKVVIENILEDIVTSDPRWSVVLLRYFNPVGAHESGLIGEDPKGTPQNLCPYIVQVAAGRRDMVTVFGNDYDTVDGTGVRDYIHVVDLARGHLAALPFMREGQGVRIYNLGTGQGVSVLEMIHAFEKASGHKVPYVIGPRRPGDLAVAYSNPSLAQREMGWRAEKTLENICVDHWRWQEKNPEGYK